MGGSINSVRSLVTLSRGAKRFPGLEGRTVAECAAVEAEYLRDNIVRD